MTEHFDIYCVKCKKKIGDCGCPGTPKSKKYTVCDDCVNNRIQELKQKSAG